MGSESVGSGLVGEFVGDGCEGDDTDVIEKQFWKISKVVKVDGSNEYLYLRLCLSMKIYFHGPGMGNVAL